MSCMGRIRLALGDWTEVEGPAPPQVLGEGWEIRARAFTQRLCASVSPLGNSAEKNPLQAGGADA